MTKAFEDLKNRVLEQEALLEVERKRLADATDDVLGTLSLLRIKFGLPPSARSLAKYGRPTSTLVSSSSKPQTKSADGTVEQRRRDAQLLIKKMGYVVQRKSAPWGPVFHISGPDFSEHFMDLGDFDGTDNKAIVN
ncbi:hypothetical protein [Variovorax boronicumulans]|uniref:hypothetical protein n=1 Tax=Variovorax boronicumulans TaxID=436515 RepID=UPI00339A8637